MSQRDLNTACRAIYKNGTTKDFASIEEASEYTKLSVAAIKIRCNKIGCGGKDKTLFNWLDEHTKRSFQAKKSRNKGSEFEYHVCRKLNELGLNCVTARGESKRMDNGKLDIVDKSNKLPIGVQCKHTINLPNYFTIKDACIDQEKPFCLLWKKATNDGTNSPGTIAIIPEEFLYTLLDSYMKQNNIL